jgi:predicted permease
VRARLREWMLRLTTLVRPGRTDADIEDELRAHLALAVEDATPLPEATSTANRRRVALRAGGVDQAMERMRDQRGVPFVADLSRDAREALRLFARSPGMAVVAVVSLTLALALGLTVFRVLNAYVLRALPYPASERLHSVVLTAPGQTFLRDPAVLPWESLDDIVEHRIAWDLDMLALLGGEYPEAAAAAWVTPDFLEGLGVDTVLGRRLQPADFTAVGTTPVLISHRLWTTRFGASPGVLGQPLRAYSNERPDEDAAFIVVGVLRPDFWHVNTFTDVIAPLRTPSWPYMLRLRPGVDATLVERRLDALVRASASEVPDDWRPLVVSTHARYVEALTPLLAAMASVAAIVVLIACANVSVLLLVRAVRRQHEMALRLALGASRARLARLLAVEGGLLAATSTALALALSGGLLHALAPALETHVARRVPGGVSALGLDTSVLLAALAAAVIVTLVLTVVPLAGASLPALGPGLVSRGRGETSGRTARRIRNVLVAAELAGALALLVAATLMVDSTRRLLGEPMGFRGNVLVADIALRDRTHPDPADRAAFFTRLMHDLGRRLDGAPVAIGARFPLQSTPARNVTSAGPGGLAASAALLPVSSGYFETLGIPLRDGVGFAADDRPGGSAVAVVSESLAARLWPGERAVGQFVYVPNSLAPDALTTPHRVVGVAGDVQELPPDGAGVRLDLDRLDLYVPLLQAPDRFGFLYVPDGAFGRDPDRQATLRRAVAAVHPEAAVSSLRSLGALLDAVRGRPRRLAWLLSLLAASATLLALIGVYGVLAYAVRQREREIGVRMAVGAAPHEITGMFVREGARLLMQGLAAGVLAAVTLGRALEAQLFGVAALEPRLLAGALVALAACGGLAFWWPARRAARVAPADVLRGE